MCEYLVWLVAEARLEWFCLEDDDYRPQLPDAQGVLHSRVFPDLPLPVAPLLAGDIIRVLAGVSRRNSCRWMLTLRADSGVIELVRRNYEANRKFGESTREG